MFHIWVVEEGERYWWWEEDGGAMTNKGGSLEDSWVNFSEVDELNKILKMCQRGTLKGTCHYLSV